MKLDDKKKNMAGKMQDDKKHYRLLASMEGQSSKRKYYKDRIKDIAKQQKGKESLNIPRGEKNENNHMMEGPNEHNRA